MELEIFETVSLLGFAMALVLGGVANKTHFCTLGAVSDWLNMGLKGRMGAWVLAMGIAMAGTHLLQFLGLLDLDDTMYRQPMFGLLSYITGGVLFGIGMTLCGGCGQRTLVRMGSGNLKSVVVFLILALTAYMTLRGLLALVRIRVFDPLAIDLADKGFEQQGLVNMLSTAAGIEVSALLQLVSALVIAVLMIVWALSQSALRKNFDNLLAGIVVGLCVVGAWYITGVIGNDDFDPTPVEGLSFVAPSGNTVSYLMTFTGAQINFGIAVVLGMVAGSFVYAVVTRTFSIETFKSREDMINHMLGAVLMGFGGVLAFGCTIGQGITGVSTLSLGSFVALISIMLGSALTMRYQLHRMDEGGVFGSAGAAVADIMIPARLGE